jgi:carboxyl-terminal processing protease
MVMMKKTFPQTAAMFLLFSGLFISGKASCQMMYEQTYKFGKVLEWIDKYYVDSVNQEFLVEHAIESMLKDLDPHSSYLNKKEVAQLNEPLQGNFEGIGVSFSILHDTVYVISTIVGGPSERAGILAGDRILSVDGKNIAGIGVGNEQVFALLKGKKGSQVMLTVKRKSQGVQKISITRDKIPIHSVEASYKVDSDIGYIKINRFSMNTMDEFQAALGKLKDLHLKNLILDITGNGGGYLEVAINLADQFLDKGRLVVYTQGVNSPRKDYFATREGNFEKGHLVILIDEGSASASEILSGAIQDWDRGIIVGRRSFGKGLVQKPMYLPDQSMIRLTVAKYYTPTGRLIQKPYRNDSKDDYDHDLANRFINGEMWHSDSIHFPDSLKYFTLRNTRIVYGGGGIMPDYFVSIDTGYYSPYYRKVISKGLINRYVLEYLDANRSKLEAAFPEFESYRDGFSAETELVEGFIGFAAENGVPENRQELAVSGNRLALMLKAYLARDLWSANAFYEITNAEEPEFETAVTILKNWDKYEAMLLNAN